MTDAELGYYAGFFDGEGCIQIVRTGSRSKVRDAAGGLTVNTIVVNTDRGPLELLQAAFGGTIHRKIPGQFSRYPAFHWMLHGKKAAPFLAAIAPYLVSKRAQAEAALVFAETYHNPWRIPGASGRPISLDGFRLRRLAFFAFRQAMDAKLGRGLSWAL